MLRLLMMMLWLAVLNETYGFSSSSNHAIVTPHSALSAGASDAYTENDDKILSRNLVASLDLVPLLRGVANHAGTRRGREALLALVGEAEFQKRGQQRNVSKRNAVSTRRKMMDSLLDNGGPESHETEDTNEGAPVTIASVATSAAEAREEYDLTKQAMLALRNTHGFTYPPLYGANSSPWDTASVAETDFDDWLSLSTGIDDWTLEYVLQADRIVDNLLKVRQWAENDSTRKKLPGLSALGMKISRKALLSLHREIEGSVQVVRSRSLLDPRGKRSYSFRLNPERFSALESIYEREADLVEAIDKEMTIALRKLKGSNEVTIFQGRKVLSVPKSLASPDLGIVRGTSDTGGRCFVEPHQVVSFVDEFVRIQQQAQKMIEEIEHRLFNAIIRSAADVNNALQWMARLDVIFAKAAWGDTMNGSIPVVGDEGRIEVKKFVHPVLKMSSSDPESVVPIDLLMPSEQGSRALILSGANGGGKTVALKSFGLSCILCKLGIPVPSTSSSMTRPRIDFLDDVLIEVGDKQSVMEGESTLMARLNVCASLIKQVSNAEIASPCRSSLILLDELGGGTDPNAGSAIAQAVLEKLIESPKCQVVATTHSPQLKALSLESDQFNCATVVLKKDPFNPSSLQPAFRLAYGSIGDSHALLATKRCTPALPDDVLSRVTEIMSANDSLGHNQGESDHIGALTRYLEKQAEAASYARMLAEKFQEDSASCRDAMLSLSEAHALHLSGMEKRLENIFQELTLDESNDKVDVIGETLSELRVVKKKVKSEADLLRERGLKVMPDSYQVSDGESVVILAKGEWEGEMANIVMSEEYLKEELASNEVLVMPSVTPWSVVSSSPPGGAGLHPMTLEPLKLKRFEVAIWDYDSVWEVDRTPSQATSIRESRRKLYEVLSTVKSNSASKQSTKSSRENLSENKTFVSSRQRKAAKKQRKRKRSKKSKN